MLPESMNMIEQKKNMNWRKIEQKNAAWNVDEALWQLRQQSQSRKEDFLNFILTFPPLTISQDA